MAPYGSISLYVAFFSHRGSKAGYLLLFYTFFGSSLSSLTVVNATHHFPHCRFTLLRNYYAIQSAAGMPHLHSLGMDFTCPLVSCHIAVSRPDRGIVLSGTL